MVSSPGPKSAAEAPSAPGGPARPVPGEALPTAFVGAVWLGMLAAAVYFVLAYGSTVPAWDDIHTLLAVQRAEGVPLGWLWEQHTFHRLPLPRALVWVLLGPTHDLRAVLLLDVLLLGAVSLAMVLAVRRLRGRTVYADAVFPLLWLHWGNAENLLMASSTPFTLAAAATSAFAIAVCLGSRPQDPRSLPLAGGIALALPLMGGPGLVQLPALLAWLLPSSLGRLRSGNPGTRRAARLALALSAGSLALLALYFVGFRMPLGSAERVRPLDVWTGAMRFLSLSIGPEARAWWPLSGWLVGGLTVATALRLGVVLRRQPAERLRAGGLLACLAAVLLQGLAIGWARAGAPGGTGFAARYLIQSVPVLCCVLLAWTVYGPPAVARGVRVALYTLMCLVVLGYTQDGRRAGSARRNAVALLVRDAQRGLSDERLAAEHGRVFHHTPAIYQRRLGDLRRAGLPPFDRAAADGEPPGAAGTESDARHPGLVSQPSVVRSSQPARDETLEGSPVLVVHAEAELRYPLRGGERELRGLFGVHPDAYRYGKNDGMLFRIELDDGVGSPRVLMERELRPRRRSDDRGLHELVLPLPEDARGELVLRTTNRPGRNRHLDWGVWTGVELR